MRYKNGVSMDGVQPPTWYMVGVAKVIFSNHGQELVVTSLTDGVHPDAKNIHGRGFAADMRTHDMTAETISAIVADLKSALFNLGYDIVEEGNHIHGEYDPKPGRDSWTMEVV